MTLLFTFAGAVIGAAVVPLAARRAAAQPIAVELDAEHLVLDQADTHPGLAAASGLAPEAFTDPDRRDRWAELAVVTVDDVTAPAGFAAAAVKVAAAHDDRTLYPGRTPVVASGDPRRPLRRRPAPFGLLRYFFAAVIGASFGFAAPLVATGSVVVVVAVALMLIGALIVTLVDHDTLLIDLEAYAATYLPAWALLAWWGAATGNTTVVLVGAAAGVLLAVLMALFGFVLGRLRGMTMLGGGDPLLAVSAVGLPVALTADPNAAPLALFCACAIALVTWAVAAVRIGAGVRTPFAFGPGIALGGLVALYLLV